MHSKKAFLALIVVAALGIFGCSTSVMEIDGSSEGPATVNFKNSPVDIKILDTRTRFVGGLLQVNAEIESGISSRYLLEYKFSWYDSHGMEIDSARSAWIPLYMNGREVKTIQGVAPNPAARAFKIRIREADDN
ncbi:MAG: DUF1425 domain-containing protein [Candidatus Nanoarchaeia archaeon]